MIVIMRSREEVTGGCGFFVNRAIESSSELKGLCAKEQALALESSS